MAANKDQRKDCSYARVRACACVQEEVNVIKPNKHTSQRRGLLKLALYIFMIPSQTRDLSCHIKITSDVCHAYNVNPALSCI